jgi:hypothetical protein
MKRIKIQQKGLKGSDSQLELKMPKGMQANQDNKNLNAPSPKYHPQ